MPCWKTTAKRRPDGQPLLPRRPRAVLEKCREVGRAGYRPTRGRGITVDEAFQEATGNPVAVTADIAHRIPAGWYPDRNDRSRRRWWNGVEWTEYFSANPDTQQVRAHQAPTLRR